MSLIMPIFGVISDKIASSWQPGSLFCLLAIPSSVFLCPCLEQNGAIIAYPEGNSKTPEIVKLCGYKVGMGTKLSLSAVGDT